MASRYVSQGSTYEAQSQRYCMLVEGRCYAGSLLWKLIRYISVRYAYQCWTRKDKQPCVVASLYANSIVIRPLCLPASRATIRHHCSAWLPAAIFSSETGAMVSIRMLPWVSESCLIPG
jgi:hypothetical protein